MAGAEAKYRCNRALGCCCVLRWLQGLTTGACMAVGASDGSWAGGVQVGVPLAPVAVQESGLAPGTRAGAWS